MTDIEDVLSAITDDGLRARVAEGWGLHQYTPMPQGDPAQALIASAGMTVPTIYRQGCYICMDPEFALMGMSLCRVCPDCGGHIPGDDVVCDDCHYDLTWPDVTREDEGFYRFGSDDE